MRKAVFFIIFLILVTSVYGIGVRPSSIILPYEPGETKTFEFNGVNLNDEDTNVKMFIVGPLKEYITFSETTSVLPGDSMKPFTFTIKYPVDMKPGTHSSKLFIEETVGAEDFLAGANALGAKSAIIMHINLKVPFDGKYLEAEIPTMRAVIPGEVIYLQMYLYNYGSEILYGLQSDLVIKAPDGTIVDNIETTECEELVPMNKGEVRAIWTVPYEAQIGEYTIFSQIDYGGEKPAMVKRDFRIGEQTINIVNIRTENIEANGVGKFLIDVQSEWNKEIPYVYAEITIMDNQKVVDVVKTSAVSVHEFSKQTLTGYWEIGNALLPEYNANVKVYFGDESTERMISFGPGKEASFERPAQFNVFAIVGITIVSVLLIVILGVFLFLFLIHRREDKEKEANKAKKIKKRKKRK